VGAVIQRSNSSAVSGTLWPQESRTATCQQESRTANCQRESRASHADQRVHSIAGQLSSVRTSGREARSLACRQNSYPRPMKTDDLPLGQLYLADVRTRLRGVKVLGEGALAQLREGEGGVVLSPGGNSAGVLVQHLAGNMRSRWGGLRSGYAEGAEGEAGTRDRDAEFGERRLDLGELHAEWEDGWAVFLDALEHLTPADLTRTLSIRGEPHTVLAAIQRQVAHYSGHVYQLVFLVKTLRGEDWQTLSIPRGGSAAYNAQMEERRGLSARPVLTPRAASRRGGASLPA